MVAGGDLIGSETLAEAAEVIRIDVFAGAGSADFAMWATYWCDSVAEVLHSPLEFFEVGVIFETGDTSEKCTDPVLSLIHI